jgi:hypothetical protein
MGDIQYDEAVAGALVKASTAAADKLRGQAAGRRAAVEQGTDDFSGAYATRFEESARIEAEDRPRLASVLDDLGDQVNEVTAAAKRERERQADLAAWQVRQDERERKAAESPLGVFGVPGGTGFDFKPQETPIAPPSISASFSARGRTRTGDGTSGGKSSADPDHLRSFASAYRGLDRSADEKLTTLRSAWHGFTGSCGWARIESATFLTGFHRLLQENGEDAAWAERIADAFERAGGHGSLSNATLDVSTAAELPAAFEQMLDPDLSPAEVAALWAKLGYSKADENDLKALPIPVLSRLGNLEGVDYWARDAANRVVLDSMISAAEKRLRELEASTAYDAGGSQYATAWKNLTALKEIRTAANETANGGKRFITMLRDDEVPPLAAVSIGDLDTATNVTWAVPGMGTDTTGMTGWTDAAQNIWNEQAKRDGPVDRAVVSWVGYDTPPQPVIHGQLDFGVLGSSYAEAGGDALADALRGLDAVRGDDSFAEHIVAHSYGSTTASYALTERGVHVDSLTTVGSAGIPNSIPNADALHADHVYAGQAQNIWIPEPGRGDRWAQTGRLSFVHSQDPTDPDFGATAFGTDGVDGKPELNSVDDHSVHTDELRGYLDPNTESLSNIGWATTGRPERMTEHHPKGMTEWEKTVLEQMQGQP